MKQKTADIHFEKRTFSLRWCLLVYLCLTGVNLVIHNRLIDSQAAFVEKRQELHQQVLANEAPAPIQYRAMAYYAAEGFQRLGISFESSYLLFRGISLFLAAWMFHVFLSRYFPSGYCLIGVIWLLGCMPMTYINYYMQESDAINLFFYIVAFILIRSRKDRYLVPLLAVAMINRETPVLIPLLWLLYRWDELPIIQLILRFAGLVITAFAVYSGLRIIFGHHQSYSDFFYLTFNLASFNTYLYFFLFFGPFLLLSFKNTTVKPKFIRRSLLFVPFFVIFHMTIPIFQEARLLLPLFPIIIPAGLCYFYKPEEQDSWSGENPPQWLNTLRVPLYLLFLVIFMLQIWAFYLYVEKTHVSSWRDKDTAEKFLKRGQEYRLQQNFKQAIVAFENGLKKDPDNFDLHYYVARLSTYYVKDTNKALFHWNKCLRINPGDPRINEVLAGIEKVKRQK